jgi:GNAT superfamily N-acetyltransferase
MELRSMTREDIREAMRLKDMAGWNQTATDWERFVSASPDGCFVAEHEGRVIGTVATIAYQGRFAWIGMVIVDPVQRGNGLGTALLERAIRYLDALPVPCMKLDATPQGQRLYRKFGFVSEFEIERWMLTRGASKKVVRSESADIDDALSLDRDIFGADRSILLRSIAQGAPAFTLVQRRDGQIAGYAFGRRGTRADHLGPWMALYPDVAATLLDEFLAASDRDLVFVDCVCENSWALPLLKDRGFEFSRPLTRMFRGRNQFPGLREHLCAILGPEFG